MRLTFILPALDEAAGLKATLSPLQPLRAQGHEVILVDGGSRDGTPDLAAPWVDRVLTAPRGRARQMNAGAAVAQGEALVFLHADTRLPPDAVALIQAALRERLWGRFDVRIAGRPPVLKLVALLMNLRSRLTGIATGDQAIFVHREVFTVLGGFLDQPLMEDIALSQQLKRLGPPACLRQRVLTSGRRWESQGPWRTVLLMWRLRFDYWRGVPVAALAARYCLPARKQMVASSSDEHCQWTQTVANLLDERSQLAQTAAMPADKRPQR
jgi:rSAM/selenodomain-associated transferase 2